MPTLVDIVTNLVSTMRAVASAGVVHPRARSARTPEQLARLVRSHGWVLQYLGSREREGRGFNGEDLELARRRPTADRRTVYIAVAAWNVVQIVRVA